MNEGKLCMIRDIINLKDSKSYRERVSEDWTLLC